MKLKLHNNHQKMGFYKIVLWGSAFIVVSLSGCAGVGHKAGQQFDEHSVKNIHTGKSTRAEVIQLFGQPQTRNSTGGGKESWGYYYSETESHATALTYVPIVGVFAGGAKGSTNRQTLSVQFAGDTVSACTFGKSSSDLTSSAMGSLAQDQVNNITIPCDEAQ